jgi:hypothetical protein
MVGRLRVGLLGLGCGLLLAGEGVGIARFSECHICPGGLLPWGHLLPSRLVGLGSFRYLSTSSGNPICHLLLLVVVFC